MTKIKFLSILLILTSTIFFYGCDASSNISLRGGWDGSIYEDIETIINCEEYETNDGLFLGKEIENSYNKRYLFVGDTAKNLIKTSEGLILKTNNKYLGANYDDVFMIKNAETGLEINYDQYEVINGYYLAETKEYMGIPDSSRWELEGPYSDYVYYYTFNGIEYREGFVIGFQNGYINKNTNIWLNTIKEILGYKINGIEYMVDDVWVLSSIKSTGVMDYLYSETSGSAYVDIDTFDCYKMDEVISEYGREFESGIYKKDDIKPINRVILGEQIKNIKIDFGDEFAILKITNTKSYDYTAVQNCTYNIQDAEEEVYYRGTFDKIDDTVFLIIRQQSTDGNEWYFYSDILEVKIINNKLLINNVEVEKQ